MNQIPTLFLKVTITFIGIIALAICVFILPVGLRQEKMSGYAPIIIGLYAAVIPFFIALYNAVKLLSYIDKNKAFSILSVNCLKYIKYSAIIISLLFAAGMPYIYLVADQDDAPGVLAMALVIDSLSVIVAAGVAVLQKLFQNAVDIKSENDLTV